MWAALPDYLATVIESMQRNALLVMLLHLCYQEALCTTGLEQHSTRRDKALTNFIEKAKL